MSKELPTWFPENPYPEKIFPMDETEYAKIVPDPKTRTALSGCLGRVFWEITASDIWRSLLSEIDDLCETLDEPDAAKVRECLCG